MLDDRQYRTDNPCGDGESLRCEEAETGRYTMLGYEQEQWLTEGFNSRARWNIVGQQLLIAELEHANIQENYYWNDAWDGYPRARRRLLRSVVDTDVRNPVFLTGDWHSTFVNDLKLDFKKPSPNDRHRVRHASHYHGRGRHALRALLRSDGAVQPSHQILRGRQARLLQGVGDAQADEARPAIHERVWKILNGQGYTEKSFVVEDGVPGTTAV